MRSRSRINFLENVAIRRSSFRRFGRGVMSRLGLIIFIVGDIVSGFSLKAMGLIDRVSAGLIR